MASGKKQNQEYDDALGSIFDFMFNEAEKPPDKRKPIKPTGLSGTSEFTDALGMMLANPAAFVGSSTLKSIDASLDEKVIQIQSDSRGQEIEITTTGLLDLVKDPNKTLQKMMDEQKMLRKNSHIRWFTPTVQSLITNAYGHKIGLDAEDARLLGQATKASLSDLEYDISGKKQKNYNQIYGPLPKDQQREKDFRDKRMKSPFPQDYGLGGAGLARNPASTLEFDALTYKDKDKDSYDVLSEDLKSKANSFRSTNPDKAYAYEKASALSVDLKDQQAIRQSPQALKELRKQIREAKRIDPNDPQLEGWRKAEDLLKVKVRQNTLGKIGQVEGFVNAWNATWRNTKDLVPNIINGSFFDARQHKNPFLSPSVSKTITIGKLSSKIHVAQTSNTPYNAQFAEALNSMYYFTPAGIIGTLTNGEAFAKAYLDRFKRLNQSIGRLSSDDQKLFVGLFDDDGFLDPTKITAAMADPTKMSALMTTMSSNPSNPIVAQLGTFMKKNENLLKWADRFNWGGKFKNFSQTTMRKAFLKILRVDDATSKLLLDKTVGQIVSNRIGSWILKNGAEEFMKKHLKEEVLKKILKDVGAGSLKAVVKGLIEAVLVAAGIATGGASIAALVATEVIFYIGYQLIQYIILFILLLALGIFATITVGIYSVFSPSSSTSSTLAPHAHLAPTQIEMCDAYIPLPTEGESSTYDGPFMPGDPGTIYDGTIEEIYAQVAAELGIGTTLTLVSCPGDVGCDKIDWAWCYSGATVYCRYDKLSGQSNNTLSRLFRHELLHQVQARGGGGAPSLLREWGADYLSGNGGGYRFQTPNGVLRATETQGALVGMGCSDDDLTAIARNEAGSLSTGCGAAVQSYIQAFGAR